MRRPIAPVLEPLEGKQLLSTATSTVTNGGLAETLTASTSGSEVNLTYTLTNTTNATIPVSYGPSRDGFTATEGGQAVWASNGGINPQFLVVDQLKPGQTITFQATWDESGSTSGGAVTFANEFDPKGPQVTLDLGSTATAPTVLTTPTPILTHLKPPSPPLHQFK